MSEDMSSIDRYTELLHEGSPKTNYSARPESTAGATRGNTHLGNMGWNSWSNNHDEDDIIGVTRKTADSNYLAVHHQSMVIERPQSREDVIDDEYEPLVQSFKVKLNFNNEK
jgi:hypothetical protein